MCQNVPTMNVNTLWEWMAFIWDPPFDEFYLLLKCLAVEVKVHQTAVEFLIWNYSFAKSLKCLAILECFNV